MLRLSRLKAEAVPPGEGSDPYEGWLCPESEEPKFAFLFDLATTVYVGTGALLEPSFGAQP